MKDAVMTFAREVVVCGVVYLWLVLLFSRYGSSRFRDEGPGIPELSLLEVVGTGEQRHKRGIPLNVTLKTDGSI